MLLLTADVEAFACLSADGEGGSLMLLSADVEAFAGLSVDGG